MPISFYFHALTHNHISFISHMGRPFSLIKSKSFKDLSMLSKEIPSETKLKFWISLYAYRLIPRDSEVNDRINFQWFWEDLNRWPLESKSKIGSIELSLRVLMDLWYGSYIILFLKTKGIYDSFLCQYRISWTLKFFKNLWYKKIKKIKLKNLSKFSAI